MNLTRTPPFFDRLPPRWRSRLGWALVLAAPAIELWAIYRYAVNILIYDEWHLVRFMRAVREGEDWWPWIFRQHNEHKVAALRLPVAALAKWTDWDVVPEMYLGFLLQLVALAGLWRVFASRLDRDPVRFAPIAFLCFGLIGYSVFLYGMQFIWSMMLAATIWSFWLLSRHTWAAFAAATCCAAVGSFTLISGLLIWPVGLSLLFLGRDRWARRLVWLAAGTATFVFYYWNYFHPPHHPSLWVAFQRPLSAASFLLAVLGTGFGAGSYWMSCSFGAAIVVLVAWIWGPRLGGWREWPRDERVAFGLLVFGLISTVAVTASRVGLDAGFALEPRYVTFTVLVTIALFFVLFGSADTDAARNRPLAHAFAALLAVGYAGTSLYALLQMREWAAIRHRHIRAVANVRTLEDAGRSGVFHSAPLLLEAVNYMRPRRLGVFRDLESAGASTFAESAKTAAPNAIAAPRGSSGSPPDPPRLQHWREGVPAAELIPGSEAVQKFRCPVETLTNVAVPFATYQRENDGHVTLALTEQGRDLGRNRVAAEAIEPNAWVGVELDPPLQQCLGRELTLTVSSADGVRGSAVTVWTYPRYYEGEFRQKGGEALSGRSLGLDFNRVTK